MAPLAPLRQRGAQPGQRRLPARRGPGVAFGSLPAAVHRARDQGAGLGGRQDPAEVDRSFYHAKDYDYPAALGRLPDGREILVHCPDAYNVLEIEELATGRTTWSLHCTTRPCSTSAVCCGARSTPVWRRHAGLTRTGCWLSAIPMRTPSTVTTPACWRLESWASGRSASRHGRSGTGSTSASGRSWGAKAGRWQPTGTTSSSPLRPQPWWRSGLSWQRAPRMRATAPSRRRSSPYIRMGPAAVATASAIVVIDLPP
jgi:hypothetical protein